MRGNEKVLEHLSVALKAELTAINILFLDGTPNMTDLGSIKIGKNVKAQYESGLHLELDAVKHLNSAIKLAAEVGDNASRALFEEILREEEEHVDHLEGQLHAIDEIGLGNYLAQQLQNGDDEKE